MATLITLRNRIESGYAQIPNSLLEDPGLTWKAKGLWAYLLSRPPGWQVRRADLSERAAEGKAAVATAVQELQDRGYLTIDSLPRDPKSGQFDGTEWTLHLPKPENRDTGHDDRNPIIGTRPDPDYPHPDNPHPDNPCPDNRTRSKKEEEHGGMRHTEEEEEADDDHRLHQQKDPEMELLEYLGTNGKNALEGLRKLPGWTPGDARKILRLYQPGKMLSPEGIDDPDGRRVILYDGILAHCMEVDPRRLNLRFLQATIKSSADWWRDVQRVDRPNPLLSKPNPISGDRSKRRRHSHG